MIAYNLWKHNQQKLKSPFQTKIYLVKVVHMKMKHYFIEKFMKWSLKGLIMIPNVICSGSFGLGFFSFLIAFGNYGITGYGVSRQGIQN